MSRPPDPFESTIADTAALPRWLDGATNARLDLETDNLTWGNEP